MSPIRELPPAVASASDFARSEAGQAGYAAILLRVLAVSGYGLWIWLGMALALGVHQIGRSDVRMPLTLGAVLVCAGLVLACLRWHGRQSVSERRPTRAAVLALLVFLPVLALLELCGCDNNFWPTRLAGVALMLASLVSLVYTAYRYRRRRLPGLKRASSSLPVSRLVTAWYGGGLWLWLCAMAQGGLDASHRSYPWILLLLTLALILGLLEGMRWQSLFASDETGSGMTAHGLPAARFVAATLIYVLPCSALLLTERFGGGLLAAALAVPSCLLGKMLEQHLYEAALAADASVKG